MATKLELTCREFLAGFFLVFPKYTKIDSESNREVIAKRMSDCGIEPSLTGAKRAILELINDGVVDRTDGLNEDDDKRLAVEAAQRREEARLTDLRSKGIPRNAEEYRAIPSRQMRLRYLQDKDFKGAVDELIRAGKI